MNDLLPTLASGVAGVLPRVAVTTGLGVVVGAASMFLYRWLSPQSLLAEVGARSAEARDELMRFNGGDVRVVWVLARRALGLSIRQLGLVIGPTAAALIPVIALVWLLDDWFDPPGGPGSSFGPAWLAPGHAAFWTALCASALCVKLRFKIK